MTLLESKIYRSDISRAAKKFIQDSMLTNKSFFITGCNGLIGSALVDVLASLSEHHNLKIYLATRNIEKTKERFSIGGEHLIPYEYDAIKPLTFEENVDFYIHAASNASPDLFISQPVDTMNSNLYGVEQILKQSLKSKSRVLYVSSSEVYGIVDSNSPITEQQYGYTDILNPHSSYAMSKKAAETLCASYKQQYSADFVVVRPGHIYGPTASPKDKRVAAEFMFKAANNENLVLKSKGEQLRSYCYCLDCATAMLAVLLYGENGQAYNISNRNSIISIAEMAQLYADYAGVKLQFELPADIEKKAFNPMRNSSLNSDKLESLPWSPVFSKEEGFEHSIQVIREISGLC